MSPRLSHPKLELVGLSKSYGDGSALAVDDVSLVVERGETVALLGPSGCGKSTTLNMIVGLETPTSGDILIDGRSIVALPPGERNIGLVFQDYAVFTHMTVRGNLAFGLEVRGLARAEIDRRIDEVAELLGLRDLLRQKASQLGGSQLQRVAIGRTLVTRPAVLLLDEPLSNLEAEARLAMRRELRRLQSEIGLTIIYVTHDQVEALSLAQKIAVMSHGKLRQFDVTRTVYDQPDHVFVASFIGSPPMNLVRGAIHAGEGGISFASDGFSLALPEPLARLAPESGGQVTLGIRPEAITLTPSAAGLPAGGVAGEVALTQPRGPETLVTVRSHGLDFTALTASHDRPAEGDRVGLAFAPASLLLFSGETGRNLASANPDGAAS